MQIYIFTCYQDVSTVFSGSLVESEKRRHQHSVSAWFPTKRVAPNHPTTISVSKPKKNMGIHHFKKPMCIIDVIL